MKKTLTYCDACGKIIDEKVIDVHLNRGSLNFKWYARTIQDHMECTDMCARCTVIVKTALEKAAEECNNDPNRNQNVGTE
jgi:hypothetical protein